MLNPGDLVDRYRVAEQLGEGGMAVVYRVEHVTLHTWHALKVLTLNHTQVKDRLVQEGRVQAALRHPNIVPVTDVLDIDGAPGLVMEYIDGPSLDDWLHVYRPTLDESLTLFRGLVAGVGHAHSKGLVHRDLKPGNVMLQITEAGVVPRVADFGLAKVTTPGSLKRTRSGMTMGTPGYMAPEQIRDASTVDRRADIYSLGVMLYELVCGVPPYLEEDMLALFASVAAGTYAHPHTLAPDLPESVVATIEALLVSDSDERVSDCAGVLRLLEGGVAELATSPLGPPVPLGAIEGTSLLAGTQGAVAASNLSRGDGQTDAISQAPWESSTEPKSGGIAARAPTTVTPDIVEDVVPVTSEEPISAEVPKAGETPDSPEASTKLPVVSDSVPAPTSSGSPLVPLLGLGGVLLFGTAVVLAIVGTQMFQEESPSPSAVLEAPVRPSEPVVELVEPAKPPDPPAPEPVVPAQPSPSEVAPRPDPAPEPAPPPRPVGPRGSFVASGADKVLLESGSGQSYGAGQAVPVGTYRILVDGEDGGSTVDIVANKRARLSCVAVMHMCTEE